MFFSQFPGVWRHGDWAEITPRGKVVLHGRSDATLKINGVRMGTADIYRSLEEFPQVQDAIAVGHAAEAGDQIALFLVLSPGEVLDDEFAKRVRSEIRVRATPRHVPAIILQAPDVPRSMNGKPSEIAVRNTIAGAKVNEEGLVNPESLAWFRDLPFAKSAEQATSIAGAEQ
jgi:acetoacetyl-CoA synthetase